VRGDVAIFTFLFRIFIVLFKDIIFKITPICAASRAFACICSRRDKDIKARAFSALYAWGRNFSALAYRAGAFIAPYASFY
jgi:hypothetical protein